MVANDLILHSYSNRAGKVSRDEILGLPVPTATESHFPIAHGQLLEAVTTSLVETGGFEIRKEQHALTSGGERYFATLDLKSSNSDFGLVVGIRNSHDRSFAAGLSVGSRVFVCDNLAFSGDIVIARRHTRFIERDLIGMVAKAVGTIGAMGKDQEFRIAAYRESELVDLHVNNLLIKALDARACVATQIPHILKEYRHPQHGEFTPRTVWSLFNAFTEVYKTQADEVTHQRSRKLHGMVDAYLGLSALAV